MLNNTLKLIEDNKKEGNSFKDTYYTDVLPKQNNELEIVYYAMCQSPDKDFKSSDIPLILEGADTNRAARIYRVLQLNNLIKYVGKVEGIKGVAVMGYRVIDAEKPFKITKISSPKKTPREQEIAEICHAMTDLFLNTELDVDDTTRLNICRNYATVLFHINKGSDIFKQQVKDYVKSQNSKHISEVAYKVLTELETIFKL